MLEVLVIATVALAAALVLVYRRFNIRYYKLLVRLQLMDTRIKVLEAHPHPNLEAVVERIKRNTSEINTLKQRQ